MSELQTDEGTIAHTLSGFEAMVAVIFPPIGLITALWRFGRGDVGPGVADLALTAIGCAVGFALVSSGVIGFY